VLPGGTGSGGGAGVVYDEAPLWIELVLPNCAYWYDEGEGYEAVGEVGEKAFVWLTVPVLTRLLLAYAAGL
jgi:hypothetical protein